MPDRKEKLCPRCGRKLSSVEDGLTLPIRTCEACGQEYYDKDIREAAFYGPPKRTWEWLKLAGPTWIPKTVIWVIAGIWAVYAFGMRAIWVPLIPYPALFFVLPTALRFKREHKQFKTAMTAYRGSLARLESKDYVTKLIDYGYIIPTGYLAAYYPELEGYASKRKPHTNDGKIFYFTD